MIGELSHIAGDELGDIGVLRPHCQLHGYPVREREFGPHQDLVPTPGKSAGQS